VGDMTLLRKKRKKKKRKKKERLTSLLVYPSGGKKSAEWTSKSCAASWNRPQSGFPTGKRKDEKRAKRII
jgi:hypothetical protein